MPEEDITKNPDDDDETSDGDMDENRTVETYVGSPTITLCQTKKISRDILKFRLKNLATAYGESAKVYNLVSHLERMTV